MKSLPVHNKNHVNVALCDGCGACCKSYPGIYAPEDFGAPDRELLVRRLADALTDHLACVDYWEGEFRESGARFQSPRWVRPPIKGSEDLLLFGSGPGPCALLTEDGCSLAHDTRPFGCRDLVPAPDLACHGTTDKHADVARWLPYQKEIERALHLAGYQGGRTSSLENLLKSLMY